MFYRETFKPTKTRPISKRTFNICFILSTILILFVVAYTSYWYATQLFPDSEVGVYDPDAITSTQIGVTVITGSIIDNNQILTFTYTTPTPLKTRNSCSIIMNEINNLYFYTRYFNNYYNDSGEVIFISTGSGLTIAGLVTDPCDVPIQQLCTFFNYPYSNISVVGAPGNSYSFILNDNGDYILEPTCDAPNSIWPNMGSTQLLLAGFNQTLCLTNFITNINLTIIENLCYTILEDDPPQYLNTYQIGNNWQAVVAQVVAIEGFLVSVLVVTSQLITPKNHVFRICQCKTEDHDEDDENDCCGIIKPHHKKKSKNTESNMMNVNDNFESSRAGIALS
jgi:hypothetical protein